MRKRNKILIITNHSYMLWQFRRELIAALMKDNDVVLSMPFVGHEEDFRAWGLRCIDIEMDRRGIDPVKDLKLFWTYHKLLKEERPDKVITYSIKPNIYAGYACRRLGIPYYTNVQGLGSAFQRQPIASLVTVMYQAALKRARRVFFENTGDAAAFVRRGILSETRQTVLHGAGINLAHYTQRPCTMKEKTHFLYLGRIMREKGMDELFAAAERLFAETPDFVLDLVGFFEEEYKERVEQLQKAGIVVFHGFQPDPRPFYQQADCVVLPSYHEGMSNVLLEAAATGRPLITTRIPGCREAVVEGESGLLCQARDSGSLYEAMKAFLNMPFEERAAMGQAGRTHMEAVFDKEKVVKATLAGLEM